MAATRGKLNPLLVGSALGYESRHQESPDCFRSRGFSLRSGSYLNKPPLRFGDDDEYRRVFEKCGFKCVPTLRNGIRCKPHLHAFAMGLYLERRHGQNFNR